VMQSIRKGLVTRSVRYLSRQSSSRWLEIRVYDATRIAGPGAVNSQQSDTLSTRREEMGNKHPGHFGRDP
jgi:hypothetical protein